MEVIKLMKEIEHRFTPIDVAAMFCSMDSSEQAQFFNAIAEITKRTWTEPFAVQMAFVEKNTNLTNSGRDIMKTIGEFSEPQPIS